MKRFILRFRNFFRRELLLAQAEESAAHWQRLYEAEKAAKTRVVKQLRGERERNLNREDDLIHSLVAIAAKSERVIYPAPHRIERAVKAEKSAEQQTAERDFDNAVAIRVSHFVAAAREQGRNYDEAELVLLEQAIRNNPDQYL